VTRSAAVAKQTIRDQVWGLLEKERATREPGVAGYIPDFVGAEVAAHHLTQLEEWRRAKVVKANPDRAQLPVRSLALAQGKRVYMAVPRLAAELPFVLLDPKQLRLPPDAVASHQAARVAGRSVDIDEVEPIDLVVCGSVAVNRKGTRIGKGGGYSDLEVALLIDHRLLDEASMLVTTVHQLQVLDLELPEEAHDFRVDVIATPKGIIRAPAWPRPPGILWDRLEPEAIDAIPFLARRGKGSKANPG
jgi:5-formyltetrahydrofolate cyclo-ligase